MEPCLKPVFKKKEILKENESSFVLNNLTNNFSVEGESGVLIEEILTLLNHAQTNSSSLYEVSEEEAQVHHKKLKSLKKMSNILNWVIPASIILTCVLMFLIPFFQTQIPCLIFCLCSIVFMSMDSNNSSKISKIKKILGVEAQNFNDSDKERLRQTIHDLTKSSLLDQKIITSVLFTKTP